MTGTPTTNWGFPTYDGTEPGSLKTVSNAQANAAETAMNNASKSFYLRYTTYALMLANTTASVNQHATVYADTTAANNGDYVWSGSAWILPGSLVPQIWIDRANVSVSGGSGFNLLATSTWWTQVKNVGFATFNGTIVIPRTGRYRIEAGTLMTGALTGCYSVVTKNNSAASNTGAVLSMTGSAVAGITVTTAAKEVQLTASDVLRLVVDPNSTWTWDTDINSGWFGARYLGA